MENIFIFGDSIPIGRGISSKKSWPVLLSDSFTKLELRDLIIYNLGVPGNTTKLLLERLRVELEVRKPSDNTTIIFQIGINDSKNIGKLGSVQLSLSSFEKNIKQIIRIAKKFSKKIIFLGITPVDESLSFQPGVYYFLNNYSKKYDKKLKEICQKNNVVFIDILNSWLKVDYRKYLLADGIHLNKGGHQILCQLVRDKIDANIQ